MNKKIFYIGKKYKIQKIVLGNEKLFVVANNDNKRVYKAYSDLEKAKELWRNMEVKSDKD